MSDVYYVVYGVRRVYCVVICVGCWLFGKLCRSLGRCCVCVGVCRDVCYVVCGGMTCVGVVVRCSLFVVWCVVHGV